MKVRPATKLIIISRISENSDLNEIRFGDGHVSKMDVRITNCSKENKSIARSKL